MLRTLWLCTVLAFTSLASAQICSTPQEPLLERTDENKKNMISRERGAIKYIPVTFHLVAATNGTGRVTEEAVLSQLANLNVQFADQEIIYYIDRFNYFNNDAVYNTPASTAARFQMRLQKDNNSINVYITNMADSGSGGPGVTLAYYDPSEDWIVSRKNQIGGGSSTLAHELGHFFSLAHPHAGWDCNPYTMAVYGNPVVLNSTLPCDGGGGSMLIELHNRSNCNTAGDRICDTPEDFNLGLFHQNGCAQNNTIMDKNGEVIKPMVNNFMGYYRDCSSYEFTPTQKNLMNTDYFTGQRLYIRTGYVPNTTPVTESVTYINYIGGEETPGASNIMLDWEDVPGATHYLIVYDRFSSFTFNPQKAIVTASQFTIDGPLTTGILYHWRVWPYNESQTGAGYSPTQNFRVGTGVGINEIVEIQEYAITPNPSSGFSTPVMTFSSTITFDAHLGISNLSGKTLASSRITIPAGMSQQSLPTSGFPAGIYIVTLHTPRGRLVERLLIMD